MSCLDCAVVRLGSVVCRLSNHGTNVEGLKAYKHNSFSTRILRPSGHNSNTNNNNNGSNRNGNNCSNGNFGLLKGVVLELFQA